MFRMVYLPSPHSLAADPPSTYGSSNSQNSSTLKRLGILRIITAERVSSPRRSFSMSTSSPGLRFFSAPHARRPRLPWFLPRSRRSEFCPDTNGAAEAVMVDPAPTELLTELLTEMLTGRLTELLAGRLTELLAGMEAALAREALAGQVLCPLAKVTLLEAPAMPAMPVMLICADADSGSCSVPDAKGRSIVALNASREPRREGRSRSDERGGSGGGVFLGSEALRTVDVGRSRGGSGGTGRMPGYCWLGCNRGGDW